MDATAAALGDDAPDLPVKPPRAVRSYFLATNGTIMIWRPMRRDDRVYRSVTIRGFSRCWHAFRPDGTPTNFAAVRVKAALFNELMSAKQRFGQPGDDFVANQHVPAAIWSAFAARGDGEKR